MQKLDEATATLDVTRRSQQQARLALDEAVNGYTAEERGVAQAAVAKAEAAIATLQAQVDELTVKSPATAQVYHTGADPGEYVSPGVPLLTLVDLADVWLRFDLREDLVTDLKVGDRFDVHVPGAGRPSRSRRGPPDRHAGEYAGWRATRATGDFDLRTFEVRAYPVDTVRGLRPGMSVYVDWRKRCRWRRPPPGLVAGRDARAAWIRRDRVALFLLLGVPLIGFALLSRTFSSAVVRDLGVTWSMPTARQTSMLFVQAMAAAPGVTVTHRADGSRGRDACGPLGRGDRGGLYSARISSATSWPGGGRRSWYSTTPSSSPRQHRRQRLARAGRRGRRPPWPRCVRRRPIAATTRSGRWWSSSTC